MVGCALKFYSIGRIIFSRSTIMGIRSILEPPKSKAEHPVYRYGMLVFLLILFAWEIESHLTLPPSYEYDPYRGYVFFLMLLFNHLSFAFKWPKGIARFLWILALSWIVFAFFYILYLSHALYPSSPSLLSW